MRIHVLPHVAFEGPAAIADWAHARGHRLTTSRLDRREALPALDAVDWLVVMGGPMGVADVEAHPWIEAEVRFLREAFTSERRVLGICLGAQLIAHALGARVHPAADKEIGWFPVERVDVGEADVFDRFPPRFTPLHWHGDTFDLPPGAVHLARGPGCAHQAFQVGRRVLGLQFHLEATPASVEALVDHGFHEIGDGPWEMPAHEIRRCADRCAAAAPILHDVLTHLEANDGERS